MAKKIGRDISGLLLLDKPQGITSNKILQKIKQIYFAQKAGHTGSLDPLATGMLPICFGEATKFSSYLLNSDKKYTVVCKLGQTTDTGDADGKVLSTKNIKVNTLKIKTKLKQFLGQQQQIPPMYSAIKINGEALYKKARRGEIIDRQSRKINIYQLDFISLKNDLLELEVTCSKGTYVRVLVEDLGQVLECGAHIIKLRRVLVNNFQENEMITVETIEKFYNEKDFSSLNKLIMPTCEMLRDIPKITLTQEQKIYFSQGQALRIKNSPKDNLTSVFYDGKFLGIACILDDGRIKPERLLK